MRAGTTGEKPLRQRDLLKASVTRDVAEVRIARENHFLRQAVISGVARNQPHKPGLRSECLRGDTQVDRIVDAAMRVDGVVSRVLDKRAGDQPNADRL